MLAVIINITIIIINIIWSSKCLRHCLAKPKTDPFCLVSNVIFLEFCFPPKWTSAVFIAGLGRLHTAALPELLGSEVPSNALCDSSPRPVPVGMRSEGDRQGQQNLPESPRPLCGLWGDSRWVCHGPETNDLAAGNHFSPGSGLTFSKVKLICGCFCTSWCVRSLRAARNERRLRR